MSCGKWEPVPRGWPDYLARWEQLRGFWRLVVTDRYWNTVDSVWTYAAATEPHPGDEHLEKIKFVPVADTEWQQDGVAWERAVAPAHP